MPAALTARADARWTRIIREQPQLEAAVGLQRRLLVRVMEIGEALAASPPDPLRPPPGYLAGKLAAGVPAFRGEMLPLPTALLVPALHGFCDDLAAGGVGEAARHLREVLEEGRLDAGSLLRASLSRNQRAIRSTAAMGLSANLVWLVGELTVSPLASYHRQTLFDAPAAGGATVAAGDWSHGFCFACGSWPAIAAGQNGVLCCSFCGGSWVLAASRCAYCGAGPVTRLTPDPARPQRALACCEACGGYLKLLPEQDVPFPLAAIEDLASADLDLVAAEHGFNRPPLPDLAGGPPTPCSLT
jgi:hypothetical protein